MLDVPPGWLKERLKFSEALLVLGGSGAVQNRMADVNEMSYFLSLHNTGLSVASTSDYLTSEHSHVF